MKHVYALDMDNGTVKIGIARDVAQRISGVQHASGLTVRRYHATDAAPDNLARDIERELHQRFAPFRTNGEFFSIDYDNAAAALDAYASQIDAANDELDTELTSREKVQFLIELAKLAKGAQRERLLLKAETLISGGEIELFDEEVTPVKKSVVERFIDEYCVPDPSGVIPRPKFFQLIREKFPSETVGVSNKVLGKILRDTNSIRVYKSGGLWFVKGIRLCDDFDAE